ncbi:MAG: glycosyltransferase family 39 protein [Candidatus Chisholmbacteria bacterium]|nr:glycosyltransferase family 39 protein [Candidatus Chisholmbacteria bacterium]
MRTYVVGFVVSGLFLVVGIATIGDYGINWDGAYRMMRGQALAQVLLTGKGSYGLPERVAPVLFDPGEYVTRYDFLAGEGDRPASSFAAEAGKPLLRREFEQLQGKLGRRISFYQDEAWNGEYFMANDEPGHPPLPDILGAMANRFLYQKLGIMGDLESYKVVDVVLAAVGVFVVAALVLDLTGSKWASAIGGLSLGLWPIYFGEAHFNMKDPAQAAMYAGAVWLFWKWVKEGRWRWWGGLTVFVALAVSIKWNVVFLPITLGVWLVLVRKTAEFKKWWRPQRLVVLGLLTLVIALGFMVVIWPTAWSDPIGWIGQVARFYLGFGLSADHLQPEGWFGLGGLNFYPPLLVLAQMPEVVLLLAVVGIGAVAKKKVWGGSLILLWIALPMLRAMLPGVKSYSGMRQIFEVIPAVAVLAGLGADYLYQRLNIKYQKYRLKIKKLDILALAFCFLIFAILFIPIIRLHPNENVYFNRLVGGIRGARENNLIDLMVTYGNVYKQGVEWLNQQAEPEARLTILDGYMLAASPAWLRSDISISPDYFSGLDGAGEYLMVLHKPNDQPVFAQRYPERFLEPVHEVTVDGVGLLKIYRNEAQYRRYGWEKEEEVDFTVRRVPGLGEEIIDIGLEREARVTRVEVRQKGDCQIENTSAFTDELVSFDHEGGKKSVYGLQERRQTKAGGAWWFAGEAAARVRVWPQNELSCFSRGEITAVWVVEE